MTNKQLQAQVRFLSKQLNVATKLLEHQNKHLAFLEHLLGTSVQKTLVKPVEKTMN